MLLYHHQHQEKDDFSIEYNKEIKTLIQKNTHLFSNVGFCSIIPTDTGTSSVKENSSSKQNDTTYQYIQFMFTLLPIKAVYLIHTLSNKLYSKYLQNFCHYKNSCCLCALLLTKKPTTTEMISCLNLKTHTFAFIDGNIDIMHFTTGVRFQADVRNDTKSPH